jgi:small subunit ribosomal protein S20
MPVTKTAKRALRGSKKKLNVNTSIRASLEAAIRIAKKSKTVEKVANAIKLADRAAKKNTIHKNKAARIKSMLSKLMPAKKAVSTSKKVAVKKVAVKKTSKAKK